MVTPRWARTKTQPVAISDALRFLADIAGIDAAHGREIEIGGPDVTTYGGMMDAMARAMNINPGRGLACRFSPRASRRFGSASSPPSTSASRGRSFSGMEVETIVKDPSGMALFDIEPMDIDEAMAAALEEMKAGE